MRAEPRTEGEIECARRSTYGKFLVSPVVARLLHFSFLSGRHEPAPRTRLQKTAEMSGYARDRDRWGVREGRRVR